MNKELIKKEVENAMTTGLKVNIGVFLDNIDDTKEYILSTSDLEFDYLADYFFDITYTSKREDFAEALRTRFLALKDESIDMVWLVNEIKECMDIFVECDY